MTTTVKRRVGRPRKDKGVGGRRVKYRKIPYTPKKIIADEKYFTRICRVYSKDEVQVRRHVKELLPLLSEEDKRSLLPPVVW